ncbi:MAG: hypothetical protein HFE93_12060 [Acutalibacter muris]|nr:hypothetical protein [Acutalibacter muris]
MIEQLRVHGINRISIGQISLVGRAKEKLKEKECNVIDFDQKVASLLGKEEMPKTIHCSENGEAYLPNTPFKCAAGSLYWSIYENGEIQPCGAGSFPELCMGEISSFDNTILFNRSKYLNKIYNFDLIKAIKSGNITCPFSNVCH